MYETHNIKQHRHLYELISEHSFFNYGKMNNGFGFFELVSNSDSRWPKQNARLCTFFRHACNFRKYTFILFLSKDYKRRKHNTCEILYIFATDILKYGWNVVAFSWRYYVHVFSSQPFPSEHSSSSYSILFVFCINSLPTKPYKCRLNFACMKPLVHIRTWGNEELRCRSSKDAVSLINEEEKR